VTLRTLQGFCRRWASLPRVRWGKNRWYKLLHKPIETGSLVLQIRRTNITKTAPASRSMPPSITETKMTAARSFSGVGGVIPTVKMNAVAIALNGFPTPTPFRLLLQKTRIWGANTAVLAKCAFVCLCREDCSVAPHASQRRGAYEYNQQDRQN
jgi:hypothetical protein